MTKAKETLTTFRSKDDSLLLLGDAEIKFDRGAKEVHRTEGEVQFRNGVFDTDDPDTIERLRSHRLTNIDFYEVGNEPDRPKPEDYEVIAAMSEAAVDRDADGIRLAMRLEYASHSRATVINTGKALLNKLGEDPDEGTRGPHLEEGIVLPTLKANEGQLTGRARPTSDVDEVATEPTGGPDSDSTDTDPAFPRRRRDVRGVKEKGVKDSGKKSEK